MKKQLITNQEIQDWQNTKWETFTQQRGVYLQCNLKGNWRVRYKDKIFEGSLEQCKEVYIQNLIYVIPRYEISIEFEELSLEEQIQQDANDDYNHWKNTQDCTDDLDASFDGGIYTSDDMHNDDY